VLVCIFEFAGSESKEDVTGLTPWAERRKALISGFCGGAGFAAGAGRLPGLIHK
jgi:hypothetical protein